MKKRFTEEQSIGFMHEADASVPVKDFCHLHGLSEASYYPRHDKFGAWTCRTPRT